MSIKNNPLIQITELITKLELTNTKSTSEYLANEIYEQLFHLRTHDYELYFETISQLKLLNIDDFLDSKQQFLEQIHTFVVPKNQAETIHNIVMEFKSEKGYYQANKNTQKIQTDNKALNFLLEHSKEIKLMDMSILLAASISGILNKEYDSLVEQNELAGLKLWNNVNSQLKSFFVNFSNYDKDFSKALIEQEATDKNYGNLVKCFINEEEGIIYPMIVINVENINEQEVQYFEKIALLKKWATLNGYELVKPLVFTNSYFNEHYDGHSFEDGGQQHSTVFLNSFKPSLFADEKNTINNTIIFSLLSKINIPNDIHPALDIKDFSEMNVFSAGSDTEWIYEKFLVAQKLNSPYKERYLFDMLLDNLVSTTDVLSRTTGLDFTDNMTKTIASNINQIIQSLDNFNLSNLPIGDTSINHLNADDIDKMLLIGENLKKVQINSRGFASTELHKTFYSRFQSTEHIINHTISFHERTSCIYDYNNKNSLPSTHIEAHQRFNATIIKLQNSELQYKLKEIILHSLEETPHFSTQRLIETIIDIIASKEAYPETPIQSLSVMQNKTYANIQVWKKSNNLNDKTRLNFITKVLDAADKRTPEELVEYLYDLRVNQKYNKIKY